MYSKYAILTLLTLNLGFLIYLAKLKSSQPAPGTPAPSFSSPVSLTPRPGQSSSPGPTLVTNTFRWNQLESEDYRTYIQRLRTVGCPEQTIRDIIIADLDKLFSPRLRALYPYRENLRYWQPEEEELLNEVNPRETLRQEREIEHAKREVIKELIGIDLTAERLQLKGREDYYDRRLQFLAPEKRLAVRTVLEKYHDLDWQLRETQLAQDLPLSTEDRAELLAIRQAKEAELAQLLTPQELERFDVWMSDTAVNLRHDLYGMNASEQEFLAIFNLRKQFEKEWVPDTFEPEDPATRQAWEQAKTGLEERIRTALGEERYAAYQRGRDPDYHALSRTATLYQLPMAKAEEVYEFKRIYLDFRQAIELNPLLTEEQRENARDAVRHETIRSVKEALGEQAFHHYQRQVDWLSNSPATSSP